MTDDSSIGQLDASQGAIASAERPPLDMAALYRGKSFVVVGGTGFLGKVFWAMLLDRFADIRQVYLLVRPKGDQDADARFWGEIATSEIFRPLRETHGEKFESFLKSKVTPLAGDITELCCGLEPDVRRELRGNVAAVINAAGVVEFEPSLDRALEVNAFGVQNLVGLAQDLGNCPVFHTSTCFVAGDRTGFVEEQNPLEHPFPRAGELERAHWDAEREISECLDVISQARHRADDAFRQSHFLDEAKQRLEQRGAPAYGANLDAEIERVRRKYVEARLAEMGTERAQFWGWANTYTYTKSLGEQIVASSGLPFTIGRPAIIESTVSFPFPAWNEGINTSAPLIYAVRQGQPQLPGSDNNLDIIPCDMVAGGMLMSIAELMEGTAPAVYQYGSSDTNPVSTARIFELIGLYKRKHYQENQKSGVLKSFLQSHYEGSLVSTKAFEKYGPLTVSKATSRLGDLANSFAAGPMEALLRPVSKGLHSFARAQKNIGGILTQFAPFTAEYDYTFRCDNTRAAFGRLSPEEQKAMCWAPESIHWRNWFLGVHIPALEEWVFPELESKLKKKLKAPPRHETLTTLLDDAAKRHDLTTALALAAPEGIYNSSFRDWKRRAQGCAAELKRLGIQHGDRVVLAAQNHPNWAVAFFGILYAGATVVPVDAGADQLAWGAIVKASRAKVFLGDTKARRKLADAQADASKTPASSFHGAKLADLMTLCEGSSTDDSTSAELDREVHGQGAVQPQDVAVLIYTSGTTGVPKGVMLSHYNLTSLTASLAPLFPLRRSDRLLSVLPLHHTFELTCGLLLPLSRGSRVVYLDEVNRDRLVAGLAEARITALIGVPALWESLERKIVSKIEERGPIAGRLFEFGLTVSRALGGKVGLDVGRLLFGPVHSSLGGNLRLLISGGAALPESTQKLFGGLGLHLAEGYGLTEASPVVSVVQAGPQNRPGHVGEPIPGVEVRIDEADANGVGEVLVRGPNVMQGYADNEAATREVLDDDGWLHTGDLGRLDRKGRLTIVGRQKEVIVPATGENVYPDDVEARLARIDGVEELAVLGVDNGRGKEIVALAAVASNATDVSPEQLRENLNVACGKLPAFLRPSLIRVLPAALPRTASRKVKRREVRKILEQISAAERAQETAARGAGDPLDRMVLVTLALLCKRPVESIVPSQNLRGDLAFDSLMALELLVSLEGRIRGSLDPERVAECSTVEELQRLVRDSASGAGRVVEKPTESKDAKPIVLPSAVQSVAKKWMSQTQQGFYENAMRTRVLGKAFIPANRNTLVIANHSSHLDMGLVKHALGSYADDIVALAAEDYFFEGGRWRRAYVENLTNLHPLARKGSLQKSLRQAGEPLEAGRVTLLFPEGTRSIDGRVAEFKPLAAQLALQHKVDILPLWLEGAHAVLPKGASAPRGRTLEVRIGPPLEMAELERLTAGLSKVDRIRAVSQLMRKAVLALSEGKHLVTQDLDLAEVAASVRANGEAKDSLKSVFTELETRFLRGSVVKPVSFYFSLGSERWTVKVDEQSCLVKAGKGAERVDCVLKTSPQMFTRIVREAYTPTAGEFVSGQVKSNNVPLLMTFQKVFQLLPASH